MALKDLALTEQIQELNKVAGYDIASALNDPSRKTEVESTLRKYAAANPSQGAAVPAKVEVATPETPVVYRGNAGTSGTSGAAGSSFGSSDADRYYAIASKAPSSLTNEDQTYLRGLKARSALMGGLDKALGIGGNLWNDYRVQMSDDVKFTNRTDATPTFVLSDAQGNTRIATAAEAEQLRRSTVGQAAEKQFNETLTARQARQAEQAALDAEKETRMKQDKELFTAYETQLRSATDKSIANIRAAGQKRLDATQNSYSSLGGGRSTDAAKAVSEVGQYIQDQITAEEQKYQLQAQKYLLEQQGATADALKPYQENISKLDKQIASSQALAFQRVQELNQAAQTDNKTALQNLMNSLTEETKASIFSSGFDKELSEQYGYFMKKDSAGNPVAMVGKDGEPIAFKKTSAVSEKAPDVQRTGTDAAGNPTYGYWDPAKKAFVATAAPAGAATGAGAIPATGFSEKVDIARKSTVANDTNNPGNITADSIPAGYTKETYGKLIGATGTYVSPNGREYFTFPTAQAGLAALQRDIAAKQAGKTQVSALRGASTLEDYLRAHSGETAVSQPNYFSSISAAVGAPLTADFKSVDAAKLASAVAKAEGFSVTVAPSASPRTDAMRLVNLIDKGPKSKDDRETAEQMIKEAGGDFDKALLAYAGFKISDDKKQDGLAFLESMKAAGLNPRDFTNLDSISKSINAGDYSSAYDALERSAYNSDTGKSLKIAGQDADYRSAVKGFQRLTGLIEANKDKFGVISGRISEAKKNLLGDYDLQKTLSQLTATFAGLRKNFAGSAVTPTELKALQDYIDGKVSEPLVNIKAKIDSIMQKMDDEYQSNRRTAGLPEMNDINQVADRSLLYRKSPSGVAETAPSGNNAADPLGILD